MTQAISIRNLRKAYGDAVAVSDLSLEVGRGEIVGLLGPNGAGKTTTIEILCALRVPSSGSVSVADIDPVGDPTGAQRHVGTLLQQTALDPLMTPLEAITLQGRLRGASKRAARELAVAALDSAGLTDRARDRIGVLSGGQRRRVDLAAAVIGDPAVLLLDEPTTGLDPESRRALWAHLRRLAAAGTAILLSTQDLFEADQLADRVVIIKAGRVIASAAPAELKRTVGTRTLVATFGSRADRDRSLRIAKKVQVSAVADGRTRRTSVRLDDAHAPGRFLAALAAEGVEVPNLRLDEPTLDDVFLHLTHAPETSGGSHA